MTRVVDQTHTGSPVRLPAGAIVQMEQHDQAYHAWRAAGVRRRILVHVDAHHDLWWVAEGREGGAVSIANFVCKALHEDLIERVFWIVPDPTWSAPEGRRAVKQHLERLRATYRSDAEPIEISDTHMATNLLGRRCTVGPLRSLPRIVEPVLLDVDVDFFLIPVVAFDEYDAVARVPWQWPADLVTQLEERGIRSDLITIAYSVDGGYTPVGWKQLGDELAARLGDSREWLDGFDDLRSGALAAERGDHAAALHVLIRAAAELPRSAAPLYHLARCLLALGRIEEARDAYRRVVACDPTYDTPYDEGMSLYRERRDAEAAAAYRAALVLHPSGAYAHLGLARVAARRGQWDAAAAHASDALTLDANLVDAYRLLGRARAAQNRHDDAIAAYERSLALTRRGHRSIAATPAFGGEGRLVDPDYFVVFARLGRLYAARGDRAGAIENYRMALAGRCDGLSMRLELAAIYARQGRLARGLREVRAALRLLPAETRGRLRRLRALVAARPVSRNAAA